MKLKIHKRYGVTPNDLLNDENISLKAKGLFAYLQSKPDGWDFSGHRIKHDHRDGKASVFSGLQELEEAGYLKRRKYKNEKGHWEYEYILYENPYTENRDTENRDTDNRYNNKERVIKKEIEKKKYIKAKKKEPKIDLPDWLNKKAWSFWVEHRKEIKRPLTLNAIKLQLSFLEKHKSKHHLIIAKSIENRWTGLFELRDNNFKKENNENIIAKQKEYEREKEFVDDKTKKLFDEVGNVANQKKIK